MPNYIEVFKEIAEEFFFGKKKINTIKVNENHEKGLKSH